MNASGMAQQVSRHIDANLFTYFPELEVAGARATLIGEQHRASSSLYRFEVATGETRFNLFAKGITLSDNDQPVGVASREARPRISPGPMERGEKTRLEFGALQAIQEHFGRLDNPLLGAIRVLDYIDYPQTIIMVENTDPTLRALYAKAHRLNHLLGKSPDLGKAFYNAGVWLKAYSRLPKEEDVVTRLSHRDDFNTSIRRLTDYMSRITGDASYFKRVAQTVIPAVNDALPEALPLGIGHGDYAMRNILVGAQNRITAFDTCAKWRVPIYEDIAYFLNQLELNGLQVLTQGLAFDAGNTAAYESEFLAGYFGDSPVPTEEIRLFKVQWLLDGWSAQLSTYTEKKAGKKALYRKTYLTLLNRRFREIMARLLEHT